MHTHIKWLLPSIIQENNSNNDYLQLALSSYYSCNFISSNCFYAINIGWPEFDLPNSYDRYLISFHTEIIDIDWLVRQAQLVYPKPVLLVSEWKVQPADFFPDNITFIQIRTLHHQFETIKNTIKCNLNPQLPKYKLSSLTRRVTQYKTFVTSYLLKNFPQEDMILSYHNKETAPKHSTPQLDYLFEHDRDLPSTLINIDNELGQLNNGNFDLCNWKIKAITDALFNLTNESWHYSLTEKNNKDFVYPGPWFTDKTIKPLMGGRPFVPVGQAHIVSELETLGFSCDFGIDISTHDNDIGDLTRIKGVFNAIEQIKEKSIDELYETSLPAVVHNAKHIQSGNLFLMCNDLNSQGLQDFKNWFL